MFRAVPETRAKSLIRKASLIPCESVDNFVDRIAADAQTACKIKSLALPTSSTAEIQSVQNQ
jgi:hypothetical protein